MRRPKAQHAPAGAPVPIALERRGAPPKLLPGMSWATPPAKIVELTEGASVAIRMATGEVLAGRVLVVWKSSVRFHPWGREPIEVPRVSVAAAKALGPHTWEQAQDVRRRQAAGEPALVVAPRKDVV